ncbi:hypothetical protein [Gorillibacterium sp. sgz500922]|uniref:hypothetical protein n=1 Tax=Gorillibacterium sp. sgz500922 TaxID=3446694 RepID=UPI003F668D22
MSGYITITQADIELAAANGITAAQLRGRVYNNGWSPAEAATRPVRPKHDRRKWVELAAQHGIKANTLYHRLSEGWEPERAATQPLVRPEEMQVLARAAAQANRRRESP